jgi:hypothetical protein
MCSSLQKTHTCLRFLWTLGLLLSHLMLLPLLRQQKQQQRRL